MLAPAAAIGWANTHIDESDDGQSGQSGRAQAKRRYFLEHFLPPIETNVRCCRDYWLGPPGFLVVALVPMKYGYILDATAPTACYGANALTVLCQASLCSRSTTGYLKVFTGMPHLPPPTVPCTRPGCDKQPRSPTVRVCKPWIAMAAAQLSTRDRCGRRQGPGRFRGE